MMMKSSKSSKVLGLYNLAFLVLEGKFYIYIKMIKTKCTSRKKLPIWDSF